MRAKAPYQTGCLINSLKTISQKAAQDGKSLVSFSCLEKKVIQELHVKVCFFPLICTKLCLFYGGASRLLNVSNVKTNFYSFHIVIVF